jgi:hypothetical protein
LFTGGVKVIVAWPFADAALTFVGASGTVIGVTELLALEELLVPIPFVAVIENVYAVPLVRPVMIIGDPLLVAVSPPTLDVAVYEVMAEPPLFVGGVKVTVAWPLPAVAVPMVGASGVVAGMTALLVFDVALVPILFMAVTVNV